MAPNGPANAQNSFHADHGENRFLDVAFRPITILLNDGGVFFGAIAFGLWLLLDSAVAKGLAAARLFLRFSLELNFRPIKILS
jgi:hypothetical protein